jgi:iron(III) transport system substrate-binding protein
LKAAGYGVVPLVVALVLAAAACAPAAPASSPQAPASDSPAVAGASPEPAPGGTLTVYSGRTEKSVAPLIDRFARESGVEVRVRYGDTAELAAAILEEGKNSPADLFFAQDAGALGALAAAERLSVLPDSILNRVDAGYRAASGEWVGLSGRARVVVYNTQQFQAEDLPDSILGLTDPRWRDRIGWAPTNGSFQAFVTALRETEGEDAARSWLLGVGANNPRVYKNNTAIVQAVGAGEIGVGLVNHYYLFSFLKEQGEGFPARNYHPRAGGAGAMMNVAGVGILTTSRNPKAAESFAAFLLSRESQQYFADETFEYPMIAGIDTHPLLVPMSQIETPDLDLGSLADLESTLKLLRETGVL